ncbi:MAG: LptF/LptG family permease, partial [Thiogranum sp.]|nr:LptF/LptG family permease [Thiogranum sp.]
ERLQVVFAEEAYLPPVRFGEPRTFEMFRGYGYLLDRTGGKDSTLRYKKLILHIPIEEPDKSYRRKAEPTINLFKSDAPKDIAEFQWRVSTPLATMLLALLAVPLSRTAPRQGRHAGFFIAILIYVGLFNAISVARNWVEDGVVGRFPGIWWVYLLPALLFALLVATPYWTRRKRT